MDRSKSRVNPPWTEEETILALDVLLAEWPKIPDKRSRPVERLSELLRAIPTHPEASRTPTFRNADGVAMTLQNLASLHPERASRARRNVSRIDRLIWDKYAARPKVLHDLARQIRVGATFLARDRLQSPEVDSGVSEGSILYRVHLVRERNPRLRRRFVRQVVEVHGLPRCEACGWAPKGESEAHCFILWSAFEVHHLMALAESGTTTTRLRDLALLCATCHRLIHAVMNAESGHVDLDSFKAWRQTAGLASP